MADKSKLKEKKDFGIQNIISEIEKDEKTTKEIKEKREVKMSIREYKD